MNTNDTQQKNRKTILTVFGVVFAMVVLSFASVPLYSLFCQVTGFGGTTQVSENLPKEADILDRVITVKFNSDTHRNLPWSFRPEQRSIDVHVGQKGLISYIAQNEGPAPVAGTALYNVVPLKAGQYFHKIQCFCFDEQILAPNQTMNMPVVFYIDPSIADDPSMDDVQTITLSYSFFKTESKALEQALEAFYNKENF